MVKMEDVREGEMHDVGEPDWDMLSVYVASIGLRAHLVLIVDVNEVCGYQLRVVDSLLI